MQYSFIAAAVLALSSSVFAQTDGYNVMTSPVKDQNIPAGKPFKIVWQQGKFTTGTASITLLQGASPETLQLGATIATGVKNTAGEYTWDVPATVPAFKTYGFKITHDDDSSTPAVDETTIFQYSFPFHITGASASSSASSGGSETTTIKIGTGPAYTPPPTSTPAASSYYVSASKNSTVVYPTTKPTSNYTLTTGTTLRPTTTGSGSTSSSSSTGTPPAQATSNAGIANTVSGGFALVGGLFIAFAL